MEVTAAAYKDDSGRVTSGIVRTATGGSFTSAHVLESPSLSAPVTFSMTTNTVWTTYSVDISGVTSATRLVIGAENDAARNRINISDIKVTIVSFD